MARVGEAFYLGFEEREEKDDGENRAFQRFPRGEDGEDQAKLSIIFLIRFYLKWMTNRGINSFWFQDWRERERERCERCFGKSNSGYIGKLCFYSSVKFNNLKFENERETEEYLIGKFKSNFRRRFHGGIR